MAFKLQSPGDYAGAIVVLAHNNIDLTLRCLESVFAQKSDKPILTLVIDNGSTDMTSKHLRGLLHERDNFLVASFKPPRSVASCWNHALDMLFRLWQLPVVLVLNNDTEIAPDTFDLLKDWSTTNNFVTCNSTTDRSKVFASPSYHPDFSCFMLTRKCWLTVGKFDENFLIAYCEDCDYHVRMHRKGIRALNVGIPYLHHASATIKQASDMERLTIAEQADKNRHYFFRKWGQHIGTPGYDELFSDLYWPLPSFSAAFGGFK